MLYSSLFAVSDLTILLTPIKKKLNCTEVAGLTLTSATGHESPLSRVQSTYSDDYIFTVRAVMRVDTYLEEPLRFAHDLYHLHIIMVGLCKRPCRTTKAGPTSLSEYLIGLQLRTIQHVPQWLVLFHFLFNLNYINKCMIKSVVKSYASCLRQTDAAVCMCLLHTKSNVPLCSSAVN